MANHPGYRIPADPEPPDLLCLKVYIPNDMLYLQAFGGAFHFFTKWLAWERDPENNARLAANSWKNAYYYTLENGWLNSCEDCPEPEEDVTTIINNYVTCGGCGCGGGGGNQPPIYTPPNTPSNCVCFPVTGDDQPFPPPPPAPDQPPPVYFPDDPQWPDVTEWQLQRCRIANYGWFIIKQLLDALFAVSEVVEHLGAALALIVSHIPAYLLARIGASQILALANNVLGAMAAATPYYALMIDTARTWWGVNQQELVCQAYNAFDCSNIRDWITENLGEVMHTAIFDETESEEMATNAVNFVSNLFSCGVCNVMYNFSVPAWYVPEIDCALCGGEPEPGAWRVHYEWAGAGSTYHFFDNTPEHFDIAAHVTRGSVVSIELRLYQIEPVPLRWVKFRKIQFDINEPEATLNIVPGFSFQDVADGETVLIYSADHSSDRPTADHEFSIGETDFEIYISVAHGAYQPPPLDFVLELGEFELGTGVEP